MSDWRLIPASDAPAAQQAAMEEYKTILADSLARPIDRYDAAHWWPLAAKAPVPNTDDPSRTVHERAVWVRGLFA